jgi:DNA-binding response OmpR family regulator
MSGARTVLVLEDEPDIRALIAREVERMGFAAVEADSAEAALAYTGGLDLVLLDVLLPESTGVEVAHALRARAGTERVPVVFVTIVEPIASADRLDPPAAVVQKPFTRSALRAAIERALETDRAPPANGG